MPLHVLARTGSNGMTLSRGSKRETTYDGRCSLLRLTHRVSRPAAGGISLISLHGVQSTVRRAQRAVAVLGQCPIGRTKSAIYRHGMCLIDGCLRERNFCPCCGAAVLRCCYAMALFRLARSFPHREDRVSREKGRWGPCFCRTCRPVRRYTSTKERAKRLGITRSS